MFGCLHQGFLQCYAAGHQASCSVFEAGPQPKQKQEIMVIMGYGMNLMHSTMYRYYRVYV